MFLANIYFQFAFAGDGVKDVRVFLATFEQHVVSIGMMTDIKKLPLLVAMVATFYGRARDWYESLQPNQQVNSQLLVQVATIQSKVYLTT